MKHAWVLIFTGIAVFAGQALAQPPATQQAKMAGFNKNSPLTPPFEKVAASVEATLPPAQAKAGHMEYEKRKAYPNLKMSAQPPNMPPVQPVAPAGPLTPQAAQPTKFRNV